VVHHRDTEATEKTK